MGGESEGGGRRQPAVDMARTILAERGPLGPGDLSRALRAKDFRVDEQRVARFVERWPDLFRVDDVGRLTIERPGEGPGRGQPDDRDGRQDADVIGDADRWWTRPVDAVVLERSAVVVLDVETSGLDGAVDHVRQVAVENLGTGERLVLAVAQPGAPGDGHAVGLADALVALDTRLQGASAVAGHRVAQFDLPFLQAAARRQGVDWACDLPAVDTHALSLLVDPTLVERGLADLAGHLGVSQRPSPRGHEDVALTAAVLRALLDRYDPGEPTWGLARAVLARAGDPLAGLLEPAPVHDDPAEALVPRPDDLARRGDGHRYRDASDAVRVAFTTLAQQPRHRDRPSQRDMADAVAAALDDGARLAVEAPTGTGKSLAYLVGSAGRAARPRHPVVVATKTKVLQRQLREDAEMLRAQGLLSAPFRQVSGVGNYVCTREVAEAIEGGDLEGTEGLAVAVAVRALATARSGVWDDVTDGLNRRSDLRYARRRYALATTTNSCERNRCPHVRRCPLWARLQGVERDPGILAVNHAVVGSWVRLAADGGRAPGDILGGDSPASLVFDEAHDLEDTLTAAWTDKVGASALYGLVGSTWRRRGPVAQAHAVARRLGLAREGLVELDAQKARLTAAMQGLGEAVATYLHEYGGADQQVALLPGIVSRRAEFQEVATAAVRVRALLWRARQQLAHAADDMVRQARVAEVGEEARRRVERAGFRLRAAAADIEPLAGTLDALRGLPDSHLYAHVLSLDESEALDPAERWEFSRLPIEVGDRFADEVAGRAHATVLTSATLTVGGRFEFLGRRLGVDVAEVAQPDDPHRFGSLRVAGPFDMDRQAAVVLTSHLPLPVPSSEREFCEELASDQVGFVSLTGGRTLSLFAARRRMELVAERVRRRRAELAERGVEVLVQGEDSPGRLATRFRDDPGAVLYGLRSYWEGFDAPGETLSYLVIEKPPYPHPGDPLVAARQRVIADRGGDPFLDYVVPRTAITLAQGFGRLIRNEADRGAALIADRRMQLPTGANALLLDAISTGRKYYAADRQDAWTYAIEWVTGSAPDLSLAIDLPADDLAETLAALRLAPGQDPVPKLREAARVLFGVDRLHGFQEEMMREVLAGRDALGIAPTGSGKSLCFQLPALVHPEQRPFVVISPLVALIKDQVDSLRSRRGLRGVQGITGRTSVNERTEVLRDMAEGKVRLLYVSPERLVRDPTLRGLLAVQDLGALVVDEAHCISSWGHDFRPEFRLVAPALRDMRRAPRLALTATATPEVEVDIGATLDMQGPFVLREPVDRPDLRYWVRQFGNDGERTRELLRFVAQQGERPGVVYASRRALTEELAWILRRADVTARAYHAELVPEQREAIQDDFLSGSTQVIVATKAFGMGVDKPDIGWVVHYDLPESLESYAQEAGRAARSPDLVGDCALFFHGGDIARRRRFAGRPSVDEDIGLAQRLVDLIGARPQRAPGEHVVDPEELATSLGVEPDVLNVALAWVERAGGVERLADCTARGHVTIGPREPEDPEARRLFFRIFREVLGARIGARKLIELEPLAADVGVEADRLEAQLIEWSLRRLVTFQSTRRLWRVRVLTPKVPRGPFTRVIAAWRDLERRRLDDIVHYAEGSTCRRTLIAKAFGDDPSDCHASGGRLCDVCDGGEPPWFAVPASRVPDPENLVDVELVVLQAVGWSARLQRAAYSEANLLAALRGEETVAGARPLPPGLLGCPQFDALRYVRAKQRRADEAVGALVGAGLVTRAPVEFQGRTYQTLVITDAGRQQLGGRNA